MHVHQIGKGSDRAGFGRTPKSVSPDLFTTTLFILQLKFAKVASLKVDPAAFQGAIKFLDQVDDPETKAFRWVPNGKSSPQATLMGCVARQELGWKREDLAPYVEKAVKEYPDPSTGAETSDVLCNYFGTLAAFQQGGELWKTWFDKLKKSLVEDQRKGGAADGSWNPSGQWTGAGRVFATAMNCLCLEVYYRHPTLYKE